jgi:hypothetical protein
MCSSGYTVVKNNNYILPFQKGENYPCLDLSLFDWFADNQERINTTHSKMMQQEIFFYKFNIIMLNFISCANYDDCALYCTSEFWPCMCSHSL